MSQSTVELRRAQGNLALIPRGRHGRELRFPIRFLFAQNPKRRFRQVPGDCSDSLRVAFTAGDPLIETAYVARSRAAAGQADRVRSFDECPLEIAIDVGAGAPDPRLPAARMDPRRGPRIAGELLGRGESYDIAHLEGDDDRERQPHPRHGHEVLNRGGRLERRVDALLELAYLAAEVLDLLQQVSARVRRVGRQELETLPQDGAAPGPEDITHL